MSIQFVVRANKWKQAESEMTRGMPKALFMVATEIMADSKDNYVPVLTGALRQSGYVDPAVGSGATASVEIGYGKAGSAAAAYAHVVHEAPPGWGQGKRKYLEQPLLKAQSTFDEDLGDRLDQILGWGVET